MSPFSSGMSQWIAVSVPVAPGRVEIDGQVNDALLEQNRQPLKQRDVELDTRLRGVGVVRLAPTRQPMHIFGGSITDIFSVVDVTPGIVIGNGQVEQVRAVGHRCGHADHLEHVHLGVRCVAGIAGRQLQHLAELEVRRRAELCGEGSEDPGRGDARRIALVIERLRGRVEKILELHLGVEDLLRRAEPELRPHVAESNVASARPL